MSLESGHGLGFQSVAALGIGVHRGRVVKPRPSGSTFGQKVAYWLADQKAARRDPRTPTALAREVGIDQSTVFNWIEKGRRPRSDLASKVAAVMGVPLEWLTNDAAAAFPRPEGLQVDTVIAALTAEERKALLAALRDPRMRRAIVEYGREQR